MTCGSSTIVLVLLVALWGFAAGIMVALGRAAGAVALLSALGLIVVADYPTSVGAAFDHAAFGLAGGAFQALLALALAPLRPAAPQRRAVAGCCRILARTAASPRGREFALAIDEADRALGSSAGQAAASEPLGQALRGCLDIVDRIYVELAALALAAERSAPRPAAAEIVAAAATTLEAGADAIESGRAVAARDELAALAGGARHLLRAESPGELGPRGEALHGELRSLLDVADAAAHERSQAARLRPHLAGLRPSPRAALEILRANLTLASPALRHAIRLSFALAAAIVLARTFALARGYWIPVTVLFVLKPDFGTTFRRGTQRYLGTAVGVALATVLARQLAPDHYGLTALVFVFSALAFALYYANYAIFSAAVTALIVFLISFEGLSPAHVALDRLVDSAIGGALTLAVYALWPTWERAQTAPQMAKLLLAEQRYVGRVLDALTTGEREPEAIRQARRAVRLARTAAEASVERSRAEPRGARGNPDRAAGLLSSSRRLGAAGLTLEAALPDTDQRARDVEPMAAAITQAIGELATAARSGAPAPPRPELQREHAALVERRGEGDLLAAETERIIDAIESVRVLLGAEASTPSAGRARRLAWSGS